MDAKTLETETYPAGRPRTKSLLYKKSKNQVFVSISDWLGGAESSEEEKEAAGYSPFETNSERDFSTFQAEELTEVMQLINEVGKALATRFSRRTMNSKHRGNIDLRRPMRLSLRGGGEILELVE